MHGPDPSDPHPIPDAPEVCFLAAAVRHPAITIGAYTYADEPEGAAGFLANVRYLFPFSRDRLVIGSFCAIGRGVQFFLNDANHAMEGFSTYPFEIFGHGWEAAAGAGPAERFRGDTVIGHDVWLGSGALILAGVTVGDGAIVGARAVVGSDVAPYTVVAGNPARPIRRRFPEPVCERLRALAWWHWPIERITANLAAIRGADLATLEAAAEG